MCVHYSGYKEYNKMKGIRYLPIGSQSLQEKTDSPKNVQSSLKEVYAKYPGQEQSDEFCLTVKNDSTEELYLSLMTKGKNV